MLDCHLLDTGYCIVSESQMIQGGQQRKIHCHAIVALLRHPTQGWLLWDTGYAPRMIEAMRPWPYRIYALATPLHARPEQAVVKQLPRWGLHAEDIHHIILSHFHADHLAGLRDFPDATPIATRAGYEAVAGRTGLAALRRAVLPVLLPEDFTARALLLATPFRGPPLPGLGPTHDLFGDGLLRLVELPGHARGQVGLLAQTTQGPRLFAADGAWLSQAIREQRPPAAITRLFVDDFQAVTETLRRLHEFARACPEVLILPTHCPEIFEREVKPWPPALSP
ncbi:MAG: MBL fold metallo-hydrolase [Ardenticatenales bacterium]|nr:MBL fold metallo-hydrolase [Ardenticatenales bacterium]